MDVFSVLKIVCYFLAVPVAFGIVFVSFSKFIHCWQDASDQKKDGMALILLLLVVALAVARMVMTAGDEHGHKVWLSIILLATHVHFSQKELRSRAGYAPGTLLEKKHEALKLGFQGAWNSKYHWGIFVIVSVIIYWVLL